MGIRPAGLLRAAALVVFAAVAGAPGFAQAPAAAAVTLDAISIHPSAAANGRFSIATDAGRATLQNVSLAMLIQLAYNLQPWQMSAPDWLDAERFDVAAVASGPVQPDQILPLLKDAVTRQFQLATHTEARPVHVYVMTVASGAHPLQPSDSPTGMRMSNTDRGAHVEGTVSMDWLAENLSRQLDRPVVNRTGLGSGNFAIVLDFSPGPAAAANADPRLAPPLFDAVQQQLGLKLTAANVDMSVLVIDHAEHLPTGN